MKTIFITILVLLLIGFGAYQLMDNPDVDVQVNTTEQQNEQQATTTEQVPATDENKEETVIGKSVQGVDIKAYHYGTGDKDVLFIGGIHGGYAWGTSLLAYQLIDHLKANPDVIPENVRVTVIPVMNPDGLKKATGETERFTSSDVSTSQETLVSGRFNANNVDLNRNFDCDWQSSGVWQSKTVSGGTAAFSEPEALAIKNYVDANKPDAVVTWYSAGGGVFASNCHGGTLAQTTALTQEYAKASGYRAYETFDFYEITGDMVNWFAKNNIPAISVLLTSHSNTEWDKNKAGIEAILNLMAK